MKITTLAWTAVAMVVIAAPELVAQETPPSLQICMSDGPASGGVGFQARAQASRIFSEIGVAIRWSCTGSRDLSIAVRTSAVVTTPVHLDALAFATPSENRIEVMYDRVGKAAVTRTAVPTILAFVLVHEITHVLEGTSRHSETGIMKAHWDTNDYYAMAIHALPFAAVDVDLIQRGLKTRSAGLMAAK